jgi:hypothetical protein
MPSIITTKDLSVEDKSELKTGNTRRRHDMPGKECDKIIDPVERQKCRNYQGKYAKQSPGAAPAKKAPMSSGIKKSGY